MRLVLTNANLIDCLDPDPIPQASVSIEDGRIVEVTDGSRSLDTRDAQVIDLDGAFCCPDYGMSTSIPNTSRAPA